MLADSELAEVITEPTDLLVREIVACGFDGPATLAVLAGLSSGIENNRELATIGLTKLRGRNETTDILARRIAGRIADLEAAVRHAKPGIVDGLALNGNRLRIRVSAKEKGRPRGKPALRGKSSKLEGKLLGKALFRGKIVCQTDSMLLHH